MKSKLSRMILGSILLLLVAACSNVETSTPTKPSPVSVSAASPASVSAPSTGQLTDVSVVMGYIPNVQFAPWYVAQTKGFFKDAGLNVKFTWGFEVDGIKFVGANQSDFALLGGDQILQARDQKIPLVYVANYYNGFPIVIVSLKDKNITKPQDLIGKRIGLPAFFGATYTGWRALLYGAKINESDVKAQDVGFAQVAALTQGTVDAVAVYTNNEPVQLKLQGKEINIIRVTDYSPLVGIGLATNEKTIADKPQVIKSLVSALERSVKYCIDNPSDALSISIQNIPEAGGNQQTMTDQILRATIELWKNPHLGYSDPSAWAASYKFMKDAGFIKTDFDVTQAYTNTFVP